jgi:hypothetical protein
MMHVLIQDLISVFKQLPDRDRVFSKESVACGTQRAIKEAKSNTEPVGVYTGTESGFKQGE